MKPTFFIILLISSFIASAQVKEDSSSNVIYYVDSVRVSSLSAVNPANISGILIIRTIDSVNKIKGMVYISSKKHAYHFLTIGELTKRAITTSERKTQPVIYFFNDKLVTDTTGMKFGYMVNVDVIDGSQIKAFKGLLSHVIVLKINSTDNIPIYIRGNPALTLFKQ